MAANSWGGGVAKERCGLLFGLRPTGMPYAIWLINGWKLQLELATRRKELFRLMDGDTNAQRDSGVPGLIGRCVNDAAARDWFNCLSPRSSPRGPPYLIGMTKPRTI